MGNVNLRAPATVQQAKALSALRTISSIPSLIGACYMIHHIVCSRKRRNRACTQILLGMGTMDLIYGICTFASTWPIPQDNMRAQYTHGNWTSCNIFGFLYQGSRLSSALYNGSLTLHYLLTIRYSWRERQMQRILPILHLIPLICGWGTAIAGSIMDLYSPTLFGCSIGSQNNTNFFTYQFVFFFIPLWTVFGFMVVSMTLIYTKIAHTFSNSSREFSVRGISEGNFNNKETNIEADLNDASADAATPTSIHNLRKVFSNNNNNKIRRPSSRSQLPPITIRLQRQFATQALLYCCSYSITWVFHTIQICLIEFKNKLILMPLVFLVVIFGSLQGFWNALVYIRPRYLRYRAQQQRQEQQNNRLQDKIIFEEEEEGHNNNNNAISKLSALAKALSLNAEGGDEEVLTSNEMTLEASDRSGDGGCVENHTPPLPPMNGYDCSPSSSSSSFPPEKS